jgi:hypothetical protein
MASLQRNLIPEAPFLNEQKMMDSAKEMFFVVTAPPTHPLS